MHLVVGGHVVEQPQALVPVPVPVKPETPLGEHASHLAHAQLEGSETGEEQHEVALFETGPVTLCARAAAAAAAGVSASR